MYFRIATQLAEFVTYVIVTIALNNKQPIAKSYPQTSSVSLSHLYFFNKRKRKKRKLTKFGTADEITRRM